jgi:pimeloyl-ACP methyl ester carboxylesterase
MTQHLPSGPPAARPASGPLAELVSVPAGDADIDGLWYPAPAPRSRAAVMLMHGNGGNFYTGPARFLPPHLVPRGFACFAFNRRGHDTLTARKRDPAGNAYQTAAQTRADNLTARAYLADRGFPSPVLIGHSNGGLYAACHAAEHPGVRALVLLSAHCGGPEMLARASALGLLARDQRADLSARARELVAAGRPEALMLLPGWWYLTSAAAYLDLETNVPRLLDAAPAIRCPVLYLRGELEDPDLYPAQAFAARAGCPVDVRVIPGSDHFYTGREERVAAMVADWLESALPAAAQSPGWRRPAPEGGQQPDAAD